MTTTLTKQSAKILKTLAKDLQKLGVSRFRYGDIVMEFIQISPMPNIPPSILAESPVPPDDGFADDDTKSASDEAELSRLAHDRMLYWSATNG